MNLISVSISWDDVKNFLKKIKEFLKNPVNLIAVFVLSILIVAIVYIVWVKPLQEEKERISKNYQQLLADMRQAIQPSQPPLPSEHISGRFPDHRDDWVIQQYDKPDKEGFYCSRLRSDFLSPDIWYTNYIPTKFESIEFRYKVKNRNKDSDTFPTFIFSFGENPRIFRLYFPLESNSQVVGFEKIMTEDSNYSLERESPKKLKKPVKEEVENELKIRMIIEQGNKVTFFFNLTYISAIEKEPIPIEDSISYSFNLPHDPKPGSELSESKIGFGTLKGGCVKPISYKFSY